MVLITADKFLLVISGARLKKKCKNVLSLLTDVQFLATKLYVFIEFFLNFYSQNLITDPAKLFANMFSLFMQW